MDGRGARIGRFWGAGVERLGLVEERYLWSRHGFAEYGVNQHGEIPASLISFDVVTDGM